MSGHPASVLSGHHTRRYDLLPDVEDRSWLSVPSRTVFQLLFLQFLDTADTAFQHVRQAFPAADDPLHQAAQTYILHFKAEGLIVPQPLAPESSMETAEFSVQRLIIRDQRTQ